MVVFPFLSCFVFLGCLSLSAADVLLMSLLPRGEMSADWGRRAGWLAGWAAGHRREQVREGDGWGE